MRRAFARQRRPFKRPKIVIHMFEACPGRFNAFRICEFCSVPDVSSSKTSNEPLRRGQLSIYGPCSPRLARRRPNRHPIARPGTITPARTDANPTHMLVRCTSSGQGQASPRE